MSARSKMMMLTAAAAASAAFALPAAGEAAGWATGTALSAPGAYDAGPMLAVAPDGTRVLAWATGSFAQPFTSLAVRSAPPGGGFGPPQTIATPSLRSAVLAAGGDGTVALAWVDGGTGLLHVAVRRPGQGAFAEVTPQAGNDLYTPSIAVSDDGAVEVAVQRVEATAGTVTTAIDAFRLAPGGSALTRVAGAGPGGAVATATGPRTEAVPFVAEPQLAVAGGRLHVVWEEVAATGTTVSRASGAIAGAEVGAPVAVDAVAPQPGDRVGPELNPRIAVGGGRVAIADGDYDGGRVAVAGLDGPPVVVATRQFALGHVALVVDATGAPVVAWDVLPSDGSNGRMAYAVGSDGVPPQALNPPHVATRLDALTASADGRVLAVTERATIYAGDVQTVMVRAALRPPGGAFGPAEDVAAVPGDRLGPGAVDQAAAAFGPDGRPLVAWTASSASDTPDQLVLLSQRDADAAPGPMPQPPGGGAAPTPAPGGAPVPAAPDRHAPVVSRLRSVHQRFRVASGSVAELAAARSRRAPAGTTLTLRVDERATLVVTVTGTVAGRRSGTRCVAGAHRGRACRAAVAAPAFVRAGRGPGAVRIPFSGRVAGTRLAPGSYRASVVAIDAAGNRSRPATVPFTVVTR